MVNLSSFDLNRLYTLHVVLEERSVTRAAARLHVTPPAVSNTLSVLRELLGDPLVVRSGQGLVPTPRALELAPWLAEAVAAVEKVVNKPVPFSPATTTRTFSVACSDAEQISAIPRLASAVALQMPRSSLRIVSVDELHAAGGLASGAVDAAIAPFVGPSPGHRSSDLFEDEGVLLVRRGHPRVDGPVSRELFNELRHIDILLALGRGGIGHRVVEDFLAAHGLRRDIAVTVPSFTAAANIASQTDWMTGLPRRLAERFVQQMELQIVEMPIPMLPFRLQLHWHERTEADEGARYFRELILSELR